MRNWLSRIGDCSYHNRKNLLFLLIGAYYRNNLLLLLIGSYYYDHFYIYYDCTTTKLLGHTFFVLLLEIIEVFIVLNKLPLLRPYNLTTQLMKQECVAGSLYDTGRKKETSLTQHQYQFYYQCNNRVSIMMSY